MNEVVQPLLPTTEIISRMADEGLPVCAIARALRMPSEDVREVLHLALADGVIIEYPREDWPPGAKRSSRAPLAPELLDDDEKLYSACSRFFGTTHQQSIVLATLMKRSEATKGQLHQAIEQNRDSDEETHIKLVDVLICILRKKLRRFELEIKTLWGRGYLMESKDRVKAINAVQSFMREANDLDAVEVAA